jgi:hypothetical protein
MTDDRAGRGPTVTFDATRTALAGWTHVTVQVRGQLVWGTEPS